MPNQKASEVLVDSGARQADDFIVASHHQGLSARMRPFRRDGRVVEGARLESVYTVKRIEGSNPSLSAR